jgi:hypothetical protein
MKTGRKFLIRHNGQNKNVYLTRVGDKAFNFTSTSTNGRTIFTHMEGVGSEYLKKQRNNITSRILNCYFKEKYKDIGR